MEKLLLISLFITFLFCIVKIFEMKYLEKEFKPLKHIIRDAAIVFASSMAGLFVFFHLNGSMTDFFYLVTDKKTINTAATQIFTDDPGF
jgi:hypothetical protein